MAKTPKRSMLAQARRARNNKALLLPANPSLRNRILLRSWSALDRAQRGIADAPTAAALAHATMLVDYVVASGFGAIDQGVRLTGKLGLAKLLEQGATGDWHVGKDLLSCLSMVLEEQHRQMREERLAVIVKASERLDAKLDGGVHMIDVLRS